MLCGGYWWAVIKYLIRGKVGRIQVLASLAPSSLTVGCNLRTLRSHLPAPMEIGVKNLRYFTRTGFQVDKNVLSFKASFSLKLDITLYRYFNFET